MHTLLGLLIITLGSIAQSSSYVPVKKVKDWSWESYWFVQGIFAWLIFPLLGSLLAIPAGSSLLSLWASGGALKSLIFGALWGIGGLTFGLSVRFLGVALGQSIALGTCAAFGTLIPAMMGRKHLFHGEGLLLLIGVAITLGGIAVIGYAGSLRATDMGANEKKSAIKDFALTKGLLVSLLAGAMSACFTLGLEAGAPIKQAALDAGVNRLYAGLPVILLVTLGGSVTNAVYCIQQNFKHNSFRDYISFNKKNILFCALAGGLWYSQFFGLEMGKSFLSASPVLLAFSWSILMSLNVLSSNGWGVLLHEWRGAGKKTITVLVAGLTILILSVIVVAMSHA